MIWSAYTRFLESEVKRLQEENRILVSAMLERAGHKEAAHMLRSDIPEAQKVAVQKAEQVKIDPKTGTMRARASWRTMAAALSNATKPKTYEDSATALEARVKEQQPQ
jgi:Tfp pilus assembly protein FimT